MPPKRPARKRAAPPSAKVAPPPKTARKTATATPAATATAVATFSSLPDTITDPDWRNLLAPLFQTEAWRLLTSQLAARQAAGETVYPPAGSVFRAFNATPLRSVRVVLLGQDPYHGPGQADGLAFSFSSGEDFPPSLKNIFKELQADIKGVAAPKTGSLEKWARQGVLLLNTALTVAEHKPGSHAKLGWTDFTNGVLSLLSRGAQRPLVFLLWGKPAQSRAKLLAGDAGGASGCSVSHSVLTAAHPSPAACGAFAGCRPFSKANAALSAGPAIDWSLD